MRTLRVASYNLYLGADLSLLFGAAGSDDLRERVLAVRDQLITTDVVGRTSAAARVIAREHPDLVGLQEVAEWHITTGMRGALYDEPVRVLAELLAALEAAGTPYEVGVSNPTFHGGVRLADVEATIQSHDVVLVRRGSGVEVRGTRRGAFRRTLDFPAPDGLTMRASRGWSEVDVRLGAADLCFVSTHTEAWDAEIRDAQRDQVLAAMPDHGPVVLVGDLNARPEDVGVPAPYVDAWIAAGRAAESPVGGSAGRSVGTGARPDRGPGHTAAQAPALGNETSALDHRIDYVFVRGLEVVDARVVGDRREDRTSGGLWPSDHAAIVADLKL